MSEHVRVAVLVRRSRPEGLLTIDELAARSGVAVAWVEQLVRIGVVDPHPDHPSYFRPGSTLRVRAAARLRRDLGVNAPGAALILELVDRIEELERRLGRR